MRDYDLMTHAVRNNFLFLRSLACGIPQQQRDVMPEMINSTTFALGFDMSVYQPTPTPIYTWKGGEMLIQVTACILSVNNAPSSRALFAWKLALGGVPEVSKHRLKIWFAEPEWPFPFSLISSLVSNDHRRTGGWAWAEGLCGKRLSRLVRGLAARVQRHDDKAWRNGETLRGTGQRARGGRGCGLCVPCPTGAAREMAKYWPRTREKTMPALRKEKQKKINIIHDFWVASWSE